MMSLRRTEEQEYEADRAALGQSLPTEADCLAAICNALERLRDLGWKLVSDGDFPPDDGAVFQGIVAGRTSPRPCRIDEFGNCWYTVPAGEFSDAALVAWRIDDSKC